MTSPKSIREILAEKNLAPRKSLGQNFLIDGNILDKIAAAADLDRSDRVLEVGPGLGALTAKLLERAGMVVAVEYDRGLYAILTEQFATATNLRLINCDFMEFDLRTLADAFPGEARSKIVANLPYYITTPAIFKLVEAEIDWSVLVFLVQKEVALRMTAAPGGKDYGALTVMLNYYGQVEKVGIVPKTVFYPAPQVESAIVRIRPSADPERRALYPYLHRVVQAAFGQRRKTVLNALQNAAGNKETAGTILAGLGIDPGRRGETLDSAEFVALARALRFHLQENALKKP